MRARPLLLLSPTLPLRAAFAGALLLVLPALTFSPALAGADVPVDALVTVDGTTITRADVDRAIEDTVGVSLAELPAGKRDALREAAGAQVESKLVLETLLIAEAAKQGVQVTKAKVDAEIAKIEASLPNDTALADVLAERGRDAAWLSARVERELTIQAVIDGVLDGTKDVDAGQKKVDAFVLALLKKADIVRHVENEPVAPANAGEADWHRDWDAARKEAEQTGRPIVANFTGSDWCPYCVKLEREVFASAAFRRWAAENVVLLEVDFPRRRALPAAQQAHNDELRARYGVQGFPTVLFLDASGEVLGRSGYQPGGADGWIAGAEKALERS